MVGTVTVHTRGAGLLDITGEIAEVVASASASGSIAEDGSGLCTVFIRHTSASLVVQENADPSARRDLERWLDRLVPERDPDFTHTAEGPDDMPSHIKAALTSTSLSIPIVGGRLGLGTWQGVYLWEHRASPHNRQVLVHVGP
ncbi:MAG TPA: secondary thiamine-phosphate synthase enzyme YjbQ [Phycisphaerales bacterium]|nr:secondary thiamine-phosphate synthase enzyme YjbQ [Phycisphaerales bacterium]